MKKCPEVPTKSSQGIDAWPIGGALSRGVRDNSETPSLGTNSPKSSRLTCLQARGGGGGSIVGSWTAHSPRSEYEPLKTSEWNCLQARGGALLWGAGQLRALALSTNPSKHRNGNACKPGGGALLWGAGQLTALALSTNPSKHRNGNACKPEGGGGSIMGSWTAQSPRSEYEPLKTSEWKCLQARGGLYCGELDSSQPSL